MKCLSSYVRSRIRKHLREMFIICIGLAVAAAVMDGMQSQNRGKKILGNYEESIAVTKDARDPGHISAELDAVVNEKEKKRMVREVSAYNSVPEQTDSTPCISADGSDICQRHKKGECIVASNAYPLNTRLRIESIGDCTVADRMHPRFGHRVDVFMDKDVHGAKNFGVRRLSIAELVNEDL